MTTVFELTEDPHWQEKFEITVYQLGWRLGGKGASGRNRDIANRIEEHGIHIWYGFYNNAFDLAQRCYKANNRPLNKPLASWEQAFKPLNIMVLEEFHNERWDHWPVLFPQNEKSPGAPGQLPTVWEYIHQTLGFLHERYAEYVAQHELLGDHIHAPVPGVFGRISNFLRRILGLKTTGTLPEHEAIVNGLEDWWQKIVQGAEAVLLDLGGGLLYLALQFVESNLRQHNTGHHQTLLQLLEKILAWFWNRLQDKIEENTEARRLWIMMDFALSNLIGILKDGIVTKGFDVINDQDYREWLQSHGASRITLNSAMIRFMYDLIFSVHGYSTYEAGVALRTAMRAADYKGAYSFRMQAGMGDTIFAPFYEVLKKRGVRFEFFHKVENIGLDAAKKNVETIEIAVQATLKQGIAEYNPLFDVKGLPCWPSTPLYEQLEQGQALKDQGINLESYWTPWQNAGRKTLQRGRDFDIVIQGIPLGAMPVIAKELIAASAAWQNMVENVKTTGTQAFQLWFYPDLAGLGWPFWMEEPPIAGPYLRPFGNWADMSDLITRESWPDSNSPNNIAYSCGPIEQLNPYDWNFKDHNAPRTALDAVRKSVLNFLGAPSQFWWPAANTEAGFSWDLLVDEKNGNGAARLDSQYLRANINPPDLYILTAKDSSKYRLKTDQTGFENLLITGDWIDNGMFVGCVEGAVIAGKQTARAVLKQDFEIFGEKDRI